MRRTLLSVSADVLTGLAALALFLLGDIFIHVAADLRIGVVSLALLYLVAGFVRGHGRPGNAWLKGVLVSSGGSLVLLVLLWNQLPHASLALLLLSANLFAICGVRVRYLWAAQSGTRAGLTLFVSLAALIVAALTTIPPLTTRFATRKTSESAPTFSVSRLDGTVVNSSDLRGRVVVLDFWATWCPACRREMPELEKLYRRYQGNSKVSFWAVDVQEGGDTPEKAQDFMQKSGYTLPVAFASQKLCDALSPQGFPSLIIMDASGQIRLVHTGYDRSEQFQGELSTEIDALLNGRL
jgi:thiol-disulfide isomerase/thioredoxin